MCKIFAMTSLEKVKVNPELIDTIKSEVCKLSDKDGFGYAVMDKYNSIGGERTIRESSFQAMRKLPPSRVTSNLPIVMKTKEVFGNTNFSIARALIAHGRLSTNEIALPNTHPFYNGKIALIHNGVVDDFTGNVAKELTTTCDTEVLLRYWERGGFSEIPKHVAGYYAMAVLDKTGLLHIVRDGKATLYIAWSPTVESYLIATTEGILNGMASKMEWKIEEPLEIIENTYSVFKGNELISHETFKPRSETATRYGSNYRGWGAFGEYDDYSGHYGSRGYGEGYGRTHYERGSASQGSTPSTSTTTEGPFTNPVSTTPPAIQPNAATEAASDTTVNVGASVDGSSSNEDEGPQNLLNLGDFKKSG